MALIKMEKGGRYQVAEGSIDIRGWRLYEADGEKVGVVDGLLFDTDDMKVRYAIADLWDKRVLVPIGLVDLDRHHRRAMTPSLSKERLLGLREYHQGEMTSQDEHHHIADFLPRRKPQAMETRRPEYHQAEFRQDGPHTIQLIEERLNIEKKHTQTGEVEITKTPVSELIEQYVDVEKEAVDIQRHVMNTPVTGNERVEIDGDIIRIPVFGEEVVVEKRPIVKEIIEIRKRPKVETVKIRENVRHEEVTFAGSEPEINALNRVEDFADDDDPYHDGPVPRTGHIQP